MIFGLLLALGLIVVYEMTRIRRYGGGRGELIAFLVLMALAGALAVALALELPIPNPTKLIEAVFGPLGQWIIGESS